MVGDRLLREIATALNHAGASGCRSLARGEVGGWAAPLSLTAAMPVATPRVAAGEVLMAALGTIGAASLLNSPPSRSQCRCRDRRRSHRCCDILQRAVEAAWADARDVEGRTPTRWAVVNGSRLSSSMDLTVRPPARCSSWLRNIGASADFPRRSRLSTAATSSRRSIALSRPLSAEGAFPAD
jgi:hypothetical protein